MKIAVLNILENIQKNIHGRVLISKIEERRATLLA